MPGCGARTRQRLPGCGARSIACGAATIAPGQGRRRRRRGAARRGMRRRARAAGNAAPAPGGDAAKPGREPAGGEKDAGAMAAELKDAKRRLALYDHHNRTDARAYNADRAKFRRENGTYDSDRKPGKIGAPAGHKGGVAPAQAGKEDRRQAARVRALRVLRAPGAAAAGQQDRTDAGKRRQHHARRHLGRAGEVHEMLQDQRGKVGGDSGHAAGAGAARDRGRVHREGPAGRGHRRPHGAAARPEDLAVRGTEGPQGHRPRPGGSVPAHPGIHGGLRHVRAVRRDPHQDRRGPRGTSGWPAGGMRCTWCAFSAGARPCWTPISRG